MTRSCPWAAIVLGIATVAPAATHFVEVRDNSFFPSNVTICIGDTVQWDWTGSMPHSVTSGNACSDGNGLFDSGVQATGSTFSFTFTSLPPECASDEAAGDDTCAYFCVPHCGMMTGRVTVADSPAGGLGVSRNKLRITHDPTQGRGGTTLGAETLDGVTFADLVPDGTSVTLTLSAPGLPVPLTASVALDATRGGFAASFSRNEANSLDIRSASIRVLDPTVGKVNIKWETNGFDLAAVGPLTLEVTLSHEIEACGGSTVTATDTAPVSS